MALNTSSLESEAKTSQPGLLQEAMETPTLEANREVYQRWHTSYDADLLSHGYSAPAQASPKQVSIFRCVITHHNVPCAWLMGWV
jgi:hypothetical protein